MSIHGLVLPMTHGGQCHLWTPLLYAPGTLLTLCSGLFYRSVCPISQCEPRSYRNACASLCRGPAQSRAHTRPQPGRAPAWVAHPFRTTVPFTLHIFMPPPDIIYFCLLSVWHRPLPREYKLHEVSLPAGSLYTPVCTCLRDRC